MTSHEGEERITTRNMKSTQESNERTRAQRLTERAIFGVLLAIGLGTTLGARGGAPDSVLFDGKIFTSDAAHPYVQALAIRGERIVATGESARIRSLAGPRTKLTDLRGRTVIPGINDAHIHLEVSPAAMVDLPFDSLDPTWAQVRDAITASVLKTPKGTPLRAYIGPTVFLDRDVARQKLDQLAPDHPVILASVTGHADILNSAALAMLGIGERQVDPVGGRFERSTDGRLTGVAREYAALFITRRLADLTSDADAVDQLREALSRAAAFGITSLQDMSQAMAPERLVALLEKVPTAIRVRVIRMPLTSPSGRDTTEGRSVARHPAARVTVSGMKWMLDGTPVERTLEPRDARPSGLPFEAIFSDFGVTFPPSEIKNMLRESLRDHDQLMVHAFGYNSAAAMLSAMDATGGPRVWASQRVRFEHGDGLFPDLIRRAKEMGVIVVQNPSHLDVVTIFPDLSLTRGQPLRSLLSAGIPVAFGSDGPMNPFVNVLFASTHPDRPAERITREQAVVAYTRTSAYAESAEKEKGSLEPGKLADLAVLSQDIFTVPPSELPKTTSVLTLVGGTVVYDAHKQN